MGCDCFSKISVIFLPIYRMAIFPTDRKRKCERTAIMKIRSPRTLKLLITVTLLPGLRGKNTSLSWWKNPLANKRSTWERSWKRKGWRRTCCWGRTPTRWCSSLITWGKTAATATVWRRLTGFPHSNSYKRWRSAPLNWSTSSQPSVRWRARRRSQPCPAPRPRSAARRSPTFTASTSWGSWCQSRWRASVPWRVSWEMEKEHTVLGEAFCVIGMAFWWQKWLYCRNVQWTSSWKQGEALRLILIRNYMDLTRSLVDSCRIYFHQIFIAQCNLGIHLLLLFLLVPNPWSKSCSAMQELCAFWQTQSSHCEFWSFMPTNTWVALFLWPYGYFSVTVES